MSERYSKLFSLSENLYAQGSPIVIQAGALLKDNESGRLIGQLKLLNISNKIIKLAKVEISCLDSLGRPLDSPIIAEYLDLSIERDGNFGSKQPIKFTNSSTRSYSVKVIEVGFDDNTTWTDNSNTWESSPVQSTIDTMISDEKAIVGYENLFGKTANFVASKYKDLWFCTCGATNHESEDICHKCSAVLSDLESIDLEELAKKGAYISAVSLFNKRTVESIQNAKATFEQLDDYEDSIEFVQKCNDAIQELEEKAKTKRAKRTKIAKLTAIISAATVILGLLIYFVAYPLITKASGYYSNFINIYNIEEFEIPEGTTEIKANAFRYCSNLKSVTIPNSVTSIGDYAFYSCDSLTSITIPNSVTSIGNHTFAWCDSLTSVVIPDSVTSIGSDAFAWCDSLTSVVIGDSVTSIGESAFYDCHKLENITIGNSVTSIGELAFSGCASLKNITLPDSVDYIGKRAFDGCKELESITLPFVGEKKDGSGNNTLGVLFSWNSEVPEKLHTVVITGGTSIGDNAFKYCKNLTNVTLPDSIIEIGEYAFYGCTSIESLVIPISVVKIGYNAFYASSSVGLKIYCEANQKNQGWNSSWSGTKNSVIWGYTGQPITYNFVSNGGSEISDITATTEISLPTPYHETLKFMGWYTTPECTGNPVSNIYYNATQTTLYAKWSNEDGSSFDTAYTVQKGDSRSVNITYSGQTVYFKITPQSTGYLYFSTSGNYDTYGYLYNSSQKQIASNDDSGSGSNFKISYYAYNSTTYYIGVKLYGSGTTATFTFNVS